MIEKSELDALIEKAKAEELERQLEERKQWEAQWQREYDLIQTARKALADDVSGRNDERPYYIPPPEDSKYQKEFGRQRAQAETSSAVIIRTLKKRNQLQFPKRKKVFNFNGRPLREKEEV